MDSETTTLYTFEQNMRLINLAFDCVFINSSEKEKTIKLLEEKSQEHSDLNVTDFFKQENFVSDKRIEYLLAFDIHLQIQCRDQQFGRIAAANGFASQEDVAKALKYQEKHFKKNRINIKIGDILVENRSITPSDRVSILLTQNRIKNENLADALNSMGETQIQKDIINKHFGVLAIKKELVTIEQVNAALEIQKNESSTQGDTRFLGQILQETMDLSDDDVLHILLEQKQFKKRSLDLERALYNVKSEIRISKKLNRLFEYSISKDGLEAFVKKLIKTDEEIPTYEFLIWLRRAGIKFGVVNDAVLEEFIQTAEKNSQISVAKGYPAEQSTNESIQFNFENEFTPARQKTSAGIDHSQPCQIEPLDEEDTTEQKTLEKNQSQELEVNEKGDPLLIKKDGLLARIIPGKKGKPGKDVFGHPVQPDRPSSCVLNVGNGVIKKGPALFARIYGRPILKKGSTLMVEPVVKKTGIKPINGNIGNDTKDTYELSIVELSGDITPEGVLRCRSLLLHGYLMGCAVCTGDIDVKGDIGTDKKSKDGDSFHQTDIICQGSIKASRSIVNSKIQTEGELLAFNSTVIGSEVIAFKGITIRDSLKGENAPTMLQFGLKPGDKNLPLDHTIETKNAALSLLKKEEDINDLTAKYRKDLKEEENRELEQVILKNLIKIIEAPELYQYKGLEGKIKYLYSLPEFSSIKAYYLKLPETDAALAFLNQIITSTQKMSLENVLKQFEKKIIPEPEDVNFVSGTYRVETDFKARLASFERIVADKSEEIEKIENDLKGLQALRERLGLKHINSLPQSLSVINIKNKCEKGTIIKGKIARLVLEKTVYNVKFKEVIDPKTNTVSIAIETC